MVETTYAAKVLRPLKIFGKKYSPGEDIPTEILQRIPRNSVESLDSVGDIRLYVGAEEFQHRLTMLEEKVTELEKKLPQKRPVGRPRKNNDQETN